MRSVIVPMTPKAKEFFESRGIIAVPAYPFLTTLSEKEFDGMDPLPLVRGKDFR
jgi:hypothetical protein